MVEVFLREHVGHNSDADIRRLEHRIDHRAISDHATKPKIAFDQRRQRRQRGPCIEIRDGSDRIDLVRWEDVGCHVAIRQRAGADRLGREVIIVEI